MLRTIFPSDLSHLIALASSFHSVTPGTSVAHHITIPLAIDAATIQPVWTAYMDRELQTQIGADCARKHALPRGKIPPEAISEVFT